MLVEFGSFACIYCQRFHRNDFADIARELEGPSIGQFRYIDMDVGEPGVHLPEIVACLSEREGISRAVSWGYANANLKRREAIEAAAVSMRIRASELLACMSEQAPSLVMLRRAGEMAGVRMTPTFVVGGADSDTTVLGWTVLGYQPEALKEAIEQARRVGL